MEYLQFATRKTPHCVWGVDLRDRTRRFLKGLDPGFLLYTAETHAPKLDSDEESQRAAMALRSAYLDGLETFFAMLCALVQAPSAIPAWLIRYRTHELVDLVGDVNSGRLPHPQFRMDEPSWGSLSAFVNEIHGADAERQTVVDGFARAWRGFAGDFLDEELREEHNSLKHGARIRAGGFSLAIQRELSPGKTDPAAPTIGFRGSQFGTQFLRAEKHPNGKSNFRLREFSRNWQAENMVCGLQMLSASLTNIITRARAVNGDDIATLPIVIPPDASCYASPWRKRVGVRSCGVDAVVPFETARPFTRQEILSNLEKGG